MNILIATDVFPPKSGGSGWSTFHLARALQAHGHRIEVALPKLGRRGVATRVYEGVNVVEVGYEASNVPGLRAWQRTRALDKNFSVYLAGRAGEFDVIHAQHMLSIGAAVAAKKHAGIPVISTVRDYWAVCLYGTLWREDEICPICRGGEITKCLAQKYGARARWMQPAVPFVEAELKRRQGTLEASDAVIAVSGFVRETLRGVVPDAQLHVVPNLIDVEETERAGGKSESGDRSPETNRPFLMFIGKLNHLKGADLLPEIWEKSGVNVPIVVAGDGALSSALAMEKGLDLRGWISNGETLKLLAGAQALLFPSRWAEPLARTLLEAQALGVPTVAWNSGGTRDIIRDSFNGFLADNVDAFSAHLRKIVGDVELRAQMAAHARRVAQEEFSSEIVIARMERLYADVIQRSPSHVLT